ncbi:MAG: glycosyltransferase family 2 protein [Clostridia bacterium]|nr:glycosyltransferase family 2 protein [Clostridia bacterium]
MDDLVSIITPAYNCSATIAETIESVLHQSYSKWELLIVDDCSSDDTVDIVSTYAQKDKRIKLIRMTQNSGSAAARNTAIQNANGRFIALLDSDDLWKPKKLECQLNFMLENGYSFSFTAYDVFRVSSDGHRKIFEAPQKITYYQYLSNSIIGCLTVMIDKEQIPDFHMESGDLEDVLTWMHYLRRGYVAYGLNENLASYRVSTASKSANKIQNALRYYQCLKQQENIGLLKRFCCHCGYVYNATKKRIFAKRTDG